MKATHIKQQGDIDVLICGDLPEPTVNSDEVLIRIGAIALKPLPGRYVPPTGPVTFALTTWPTHLPPQHLTWTTLRNKACSNNHGKGVLHV